MFSRFDVYTYGPLSLDCKQLDEANLQDIRVQEFNDVILDYSSVVFFQMENETENAIVLPLAEFFKEVTAVSDLYYEYYFVKQEQAMCVYKMQKHYGISLHNRPIIFFDDWQSREERLQYIKKYGTSSIMEEIQNNGEFVTTYLSQKEAKQSHCLVKRHHC
ncbi:MAG: hypothetical protein PUB18_01635 [bacterium]|nr:hypothetical protein [bacterium]